MKNNCKKLKKLVDTRRSVVYTISVSQEKHLNRDYYIMTAQTTLSRLIAFRAEEIFEDAGGDFISVTELEEWILTQRADGSKSADQILEELLEIVA